MTLDDNVTLNATATLDVARGWLRERVDEGVKCPCCTQMAKVYRRKITSTVARDLILVCHRYTVGDWFHLPTEGGYGGDFAKLAYWSLAEQDIGVRPDGSDRVGWWRITDDGERYVADQLRVPKYARVYNGRCLNLMGDLVGVRDALGTKFNYADLMAGI